VRRVFPEVRVAVHGGAAGDKQRAGARRRAVLVAQHAELLLDVRGLLDRQAARQPHGAEHVAVRVRGRVRDVRHAHGACGVEREVERESKGVKGARRETFF
jgi:hypothetical protein